MADVPTTHFEVGDRVVLHERSDPPLLEAILGPRWRDLFPPRKGGLRVGQTGKRPGGGVLVVTKVDWAEGTITLSEPRRIPR